MRNKFAGVEAPPRHRAGDLTVAWQLHFSDAQSDDIIPSSDSRTARARSGRIPGCHIKAEKPALEDYPTIPCHLSKGSQPTSKFFNAPLFNSPLTTQPRSNIAFLLLHRRQAPSARESLLSSFPPGISSKQHHLRHYTSSFANSKISIAAHCNRSEEAVEQQRTG